AGKTSLLNVLGGEVYRGVSGDILVNGQEVNAKKMKKISAFVYQDDVIMATMTVTEAITFSAKLRLPSSMPLDRKIHAVDEVIDLLHLEKCRDVVIGNAMIKGVSGGERKRCAIAMEMVINPAVLFLDEPTSGLDTYTAFSVVQTLKQLAASGRTVVATLHQPSSELFHMFDDLTLMAMGRIMYMGESSQTVKYFADLGFQCPNFTNPADFFFMEVLNTTDTMTAHKDTPADSQAGLARQSITSALSMVADAMGVGTEGDKAADEVFYGDNGDERTLRLLDQWDQSSGAAKVNAYVRDVARGQIEFHELKSQADYKTQFHELGKRAVKNAIRDKMIVAVKVFQSVFMNTLGMCLRSACVMSVFADEKVVFYREFRSGFYKTLPYFVTKTGVEFPMILVTQFIGANISYWLIGFQVEALKFFIYYITTALMGLCGAALGILAMCWLPNLQAASAILPLLMTAFMLFSGFYLNTDSTPVYFIWIQYLSPVYYGFQSVVVNEFEGLVFDCTGATYGCYPTGEDVIASLGFEV
ncbi:hypothetical protein SARC_10225, partial [Sphaeroforma arctica JP610]